ncbi:hypothetical protein HBI56_133990 [Parastagonospora nodorum]|uniref:SUZ domain-containing protein n=1 Tax=Phaeosphaeria nodorum (strain SN15 / ATCC MYA-4574 / FGSC 10173) TaxID=321614 RepID=A0A7U2F750_PHANO|nr:hypothetical protein HBH56_037090 [Parastagonospora nodorum]QRC99977.1 hypothetical protein JI435_068990 [Parastagonospora nodorum SN15]KAH3933580.1 hypothetical protein HBH54_062380 [Parastagonospora nodorum]KAH3952461.1 hypothetical protein HBH53_047740 [Parastagonospora nodorum]KAH3980478.1 hypothetical protein HBH52_094890 [Parastagonospora nodorum]
MPPKAPLAGAWEDDWETIADKEDAKPQEDQPPPKLTKAQLKAQHAELNRKIWESAENPDPQWYPEAHNPAPVQAPFKPKVTMLARKPAPQVLSRNMAGLNLDDDDSEEERRKKAAADFEERKQRAQRERAEKERKYAEARERIFGSPAASEGSRSNSPNKATRGKGKARGGGQPRSSNEQSPARTAAPAPAMARGLYDPTYAPKPGSVFIQKKEANGSRPGTPSGLEKPVRQPQGPAKDGGRGFGVRNVAGPS